LARNIGEQTAPKRQREGIENPVKKLLESFEILHRVGSQNRSPILPAVNQKINGSPQKNKWAHARDAGTETLSLPSEGLEFSCAKVFHQATPSLSGIQVGVQRWS